MKLTLLALVAVPLTACAVGDENSRVGELLESDALGVAVEPGIDNKSLDIVVFNTTQQACLGLDTFLSATANGAPGTVVPAYVDPGDEWGPRDECPRVHWDDITSLGDQLTVVITDGSRADRDPYRSVSLRFANPMHGSIAWSGSTDPDLAHTVHAGDHVTLQAPSDQVVDSATWQLAPALCTWQGNETRCTTGNPTMQGSPTITAGQLDIQVPAAAKGTMQLWLEGDAHLPVSGCEHATCDDVMVFPSATFTLDVQ